MLTVSSGFTASYLSLWNGTSNDAPPDGWWRPDFDDALWALAPHAVTDSNEQIAPGSLAMWSAENPRSPTERVLFRQAFDLPSDIISASIEISYDDALQGVYLNGALTSVVGTSFLAPLRGEDIPISLFVAGGHNVLAVAAQNVLGGPAYISYTLTVRTTDDTGTTDGADVANTGSYGTQLGASVVRLRHASGVLDWEHDGTLWRVRSGGKTVLQTPFPAMSGQPAALLGKDPVTGLPMWTGSQASAPSPPPPPPVSHTYSTMDQSLQDTTGAPIPLPTPPSAQRVCGAAEAMAKLGCVIYDAIVQVINKQKNDIIAAFTQGLRKRISAELVSLLTEAEFAQWEIDAVQVVLLILEQIVETLLAWGTNLPLIWPPNTLGHATTQQYLFMRCAAFQALWLTGGDYFSRNKSANGLGTKDYWIEGLAPQWSFFAGSTQPGISQVNPPWQLVWINAIINHVFDGGWALAASTGAQEPSTGCVSCPGYPP